MGYENTTPTVGQHYRRVGIPTPYTVTLTGSCGQGTWWHWEAPSEFGGVFRGSLPVGEIGKQWVHVEEGMSDYDLFLQRKAAVEASAGFDVDHGLNAALFPFQRDIVAWALRKGRAAIFADTGLGKTLMQLEWARVVSEQAGPVLILAPLAVSHQTVREGAKFGIKVTYAHDQSEVAPSGITITNYERLEKFDTQSFKGVVLDESSILKAFMGKTKRAIIDAFKGLQFKLACTATPAPNDHMELGNHSEFLDVLPGYEMLTRWFINDTSHFGSYRLKGHAVGPFWDWVTSWARMCGMPSDLGYSDDGFVLPALDIQRVIVDNDITAKRGEQLFRMPDLSATGYHKEKRLTAESRAAAVADIVAREPSETWIVWCETDYEADALVKVIPGAVEIRGSDKAEAKEQAAIDFVDGKIQVLISKSSIFGFGLNFQNCARVAFVGATYSYEQYYQAVRRCWRFGQTRPVGVHVVMASTECEIWSVLLRKAAEHDSMKRNMFDAARRAQEKGSRRKAEYIATHKGTLPDWMVAA